MDTTLYYEIEGAVYSLPTEVESNLLRMGQEALTNAIGDAMLEVIEWNWSTIAIKFSCV